MTLPSSKRPREVEEEMVARLAAEKVGNEKFVFKIGTYDLFKGSMVEWYKALSEKEKKRLTPKRFKKKAVNECLINNIEYNNLPLDWILDLENACDLKLYVRVRKNTKPDMDSVKLSSGNFSEDNNGDGLATQQCEIQRPRRSCTLLAPSSTNISNDVLETSYQHKTQTQQPVSERKMKRFLDLTNESPPSEWLKGYAENKVFPRVLCIYSAEDTNVLYWDYCPKLKDSFGRDIKICPQPRTDDFKALINLAPELSAPYVADPSQRYTQQEPFCPMKKQKIK